MPIVSVVLRNMNGSKTKELTGEVNISNSTNVADLREIDMPAFGKKGLALNFEYKINYKIDKKPVANINFDGIVFFMEDDHDKIIEEYKKTKKIPDDINVNAVNAVLRTCLTKALIMSNDLQLPPPISIPFAKVKE